MALRAAGAEAKGATLYVTLEPCCHVGRQPPCTEAIIAAGIREVVVGMVDPDHRMSGRAIEQPTQNGIHVRGCARRGLQNLGSGIHSPPRVRSSPGASQTAATLEGNVATRLGHSQWITGPSARNFGHGLRARVGAVMVGRGTCEADQPRLTARFDDQKPWWRLDNEYQPKRLVVGNSLCSHTLPPDGGARWYLGPDRVQTLNGILIYPDDQVGMWIGPIAQDSRFRRD